MTALVHEHDGRGNMVTHQLPTGISTVTTCGKEIRFCQDNWRTDRRNGARCKGFHYDTGRDDTNMCPTCAGTPAVTAQGRREIQISAHAICEHDEYLIECGREHHDCEDVCA